ncbi:MAG TPA: HAMP domain-containing protein, partial [Solirubrobacteraceae bacterium]
MSLRKRVSLIAGASVGVAVLIAVGVCYMVVRSQLRGQVDTALNQQAQAVQDNGFHALSQSLPGIPARSGGPAQYAEVVLADGQHQSLQGQLQLPVSATVRRIAGTGDGMSITDVYVGDNHLRVLTFGLPLQLLDGQTVNGAVELARPLNGVDSILRDLRLVLALVLLGGIALAVVLGRLASRRVLAPLGEVAQAAQHIGETEDLTSRLRVHADDEVGQLATRFNAMLDRLEASRAELDES